MPIVIITLGDFTFAPTELPETLTPSIKRMGSINTTPGGIRGSSSLGVYENEIKWSGYFEGITSRSRSEYLRYLLGKGDVLPLSFLGRKYKVLIEEYNTEIIQDGIISYSITVSIIENLTAQVTKFLPTGFIELAMQIYGELLDIKTLVKHPPVSEAIDTLGAFLTSLLPTDIIGVSIVNQITSITNDAMNAVEDAIDGIGIWTI